jgi:hypothetical protein
MNATWGADTGAGAGADTGAGAGADTGAGAGAGAGARATVRGVDSEERSLLGSLLPPLDARGV